MDRSAKFFDVAEDIEVVPRLGAQALGLRRVEQGQLPLSRILGITAFAPTVVIIEADHFDQFRAVNRDALLDRFLEDDVDGPGIRAIDVDRAGETDAGYALERGFAAPAGAGARESRAASKPLKVEKTPAPGLRRAERAF